MLCLSGINGDYARVSARNFDESSNNAKEILNENQCHLFSLKYEKILLLKKVRTFLTAILFLIIRFIVQILLRY